MRCNPSTKPAESFNTQPPEGGWVLRNVFPIVTLIVSTHSRPKAAGMLRLLRQKGMVSTHSRPKAAGADALTRPRRQGRFNTQPPEGGWSEYQADRRLFVRFNTQPPEGGWISDCLPRISDRMFQHTAARRRLVLAISFLFEREKCFNTQPPEGGW